VFAVMVWLLEAKPLFAFGTGLSVTVPALEESVTEESVTRPRPVTAFEAWGWMKKLPATKANTKHDKNTASGVTMLSKLLNFPSLDLSPELTSNFCNTFRARSEKRLRQISFMLSITSLCLSIFLVYIVI
jgi:alanine-alpha-ketoisovalerate/valine-pyruvate aminotransferase